MKEIIRCEAEVNYTTFFLATKNKMLVAKTLKEYEELLNDYDFIHVHNSHLINLHHVKNYSRGEGGTVTMSDASVVDVSRRKKDEFLNRLYCSFSSSLHLYCLHNKRYPPLSFAKRFHLQWYQPTCIFLNFISP